MDNSTPANQSAPLLLKVDEAARLLNLGRSTVYLLMAQGELPSVRIRTSRRIPLAALQTWVNDRIEKSA
jgi:excisionase family DNA binding protein